MATPRRRKDPVDLSEERVRRRPATTPEGRELQLVSRAVDLAEQQLIDGTASSQVITHFLKIASTREKLELEKLRKENALLEAKAESMASGARVEELYSKAINAIREYQGQEVENEEEDY